MDATISLNTPGLLFSAISLLFLAYTNRFLALAALIRELHDKQQNKPKAIIKGQIKSLKKRVYIIRAMQFSGIISLLLCVFSMFMLYVDFRSLAEILFGIALLLLIFSLALSGWEIQISVRALNLHMKDFRES